MKRIRVQFILVIVIIAMLALLVIQAFQTSQLYDRKSDEFGRRFSTTLDRIALRHEKADDLRRYMQVMDKDFSGKYKDILKEEFGNMLSTREEISIQDTTIYKDGKFEDYLIIRGKTYDSISGLTAEQTVLARDVRKLRDLLINSNKEIDRDSINLTVQLDQRVVQEIFKKAHFVNEMMIDAFRNNVYEDPRERIDLSFLDSILKMEMKGDDVPAKYEFMITDEYNQPIDFKYTPNDYSSELDTSKTHRALLFPSNSLDNDLYIHLSFPKQKSFVLREMLGPLTINIILFLFIITALAIMFKTILTQKKLSEMKSDFISNMTHEFKTPISTISLACQAMNDTDMVGSEMASTAPYVKMIGDENKRLSVLVERILQSATLDRGELTLRKEDLLFNELINDVVHRAKFRIAETGGNIVLKIPVELITINADKLHLTNLISNLIDNAIKYSNGKPAILVTATHTNNILQLSVKDEGIGIKKEHLNKIFDKLYRIPTGNIHNVKGFGLGLSYVKAITDLHGWSVHVKSKYGTGSEFTIEFNNLR
ncbi:MAG: two-component system phosphate regulon sensor histidine kinase PhoR [Flavobacteriaceae bacterium]|jgi:two-component system phosphate regulon sensor histidine kinase PhoR